MSFNDFINHLYAPRRKTLIYRGVHNVDYDLMPYALRPRGRCELTKMARNYLGEYSHSLFDDTKLDTRDPEDLDYQNSERLALMWFHDIANRNGVDVPSIPQIHAGDPWQEMDAVKKKEGYKWPNEEWLELSAIAQHYGIPTRLLDWSFNLETAMYFAIQKLEPGKSIAIWELDMAKLTIIEPEFRFIIPNYHGNPNIRAQNGLLSACISDKYRNLPLNKAVKTICNNPDPNLQRELQRICADGPILRKITIEYSDAVCVKNFLEAHGYYHHTFFPGLSDIVISMKSIAGIETKGATSTCTESEDVTRIHMHGNQSDRPPQ